MATTKSTNSTNSTNSTTDPTIIGVALSHISDPNATNADFDAAYELLIAETSYKELASNLKSMRENSKKIALELERSKILASLGSFINKHDLSLCYSYEESSWILSGSIDSKMDYEDCIHQAVTTGVKTERVSFQSFIPRSVRIEVMELYILHKMRTSYLNVNPEDWHENTSTIFNMVQKGFADCSSDLNWFSINSICIQRYKSLDARSTVLYTGEIVVSREIKETAFLNVLSLLFKVAAIRVIFDPEFGKNTFKSLQPKWLQRQRKKGGSTTATTTTDDLYDRLLLKMVECADSGMFNN